MLMLPFELPYDNVDVFIFLSLILMILGLLGIGSIILRRIYQASNQRLFDRHKELFVRWVINCVHSDMVGDSRFSQSYRGRLKVFVRGAYPRKILADVFQQFMSNLTGEYRQQLIQLYVELGMDSYAIKAAKSKNLYANIQAIKEIRDFRISVDQKLIQTLIYSKHKEVREEAMHQLFDQHPEMLKSLLLLDYKLTQWQKILIFQRFSSIPEHQMPDFRSCLLNASLPARLFLIDLVGRLQLRSYFIRLLNMLLNEKPVVQKSIIKALIRYDRVEAIPFLERIPTYTEDNKVVQFAAVAITHIKRNHTDLDMEPAESHLLIAS
jgi:hypothetical protein